mmetsp:Transcript_27159/g.45488  ORF Transcript_27159/g.45488 Transcript_27159/m.45488 type:complete len:870 (+) Transcript_27159:53-2662(+)
MASVHLSRQKRTLHSSRKGEGWKSREGEIDIIFDGSRHFDATSSHLNVLIAHHTKFLTVEIVVYISELEENANRRLYVDYRKLTDKLSEKDSHGILEQKKQECITNGITFDLSKLMIDANKEAISRYLLPRLLISTDFDMKIVQKLKLVAAVEDLSAPSSRCGSPSLPEIMNVGGINDSYDHTSAGDTDGLATAGTKTLVSDIVCAKPEDLRPVDLTTLVLHHSSDGGGGTVSDGRQQQQQELVFVAINRLKARVQQHERIASQQRLLGVTFARRRWQAAVRRVIHQRHVEGMRRRLCASPLYGAWFQEVVARQERERAARRRAEQQRLLREKQRLLAYHKMHTEVGASREAEQVLNSGARARQPEKCAGASSSSSSSSLPATLTVSQFSFKFPRLKLPSISSSSMNASSAPTSPSTLACISSHTTPTAMVAAKSQSTPSTPAAAAAAAAATLTNMLGSSSSSSSSSKQGGASSGSGGSGGSGKSSSSSKQGGASSGSGSGGGSGKKAPEQLAQVATKTPRIPVLATGGGSSSNGSGGSGKSTPTATAGSVQTLSGSIKKLFAAATSNTTTNKDNSCNNSSNSYYSGRSSTVAGTSVRSSTRSSARSSTRSSARSSASMSRRASRGEDDDTGRYPAASASGGTSATSGSTGTTHRLRRRSSGSGSGSGGTADCEGGVDVSEEEFNEQILDLTAVVTRNWRPNPMVSLINGGIEERSSECGVASMVEEILSIKTASPLVMREEEEDDDRDGPNHPDTSWLNSATTTTAAKTTSAATEGAAAEEQGYGASVYAAKAAAADSSIQYTRCHHHHLHRHLTTMSRLLCFPGEAVDHSADLLWSHHRSMCEIPHLSPPRAQNLPPLHSCWHRHLQ